MVRVGMGQANGVEFGRGESGFTQSKRTGFPGIKEDEPLAVFQQEARPAPAASAISGARAQKSKGNLHALFFVRTMRAPKSLSFSSMRS